MQTSTLTAALLRLLAGAALALGLVACGGGSSADDAMAACDARSVTAANQQPSQVAPTAADAAPVLLGSTDSVLVQGCATYLNLEPRAVVVRITHRAQRGVSLGTQALPSITYSTWLRAITTDRVQPELLVGSTEGGSFKGADEITTTNPGGVATYWLSQAQADSIVLAPGAALAVQAVIRISSGGTPRGGTLTTTVMEIELHPTPAVAAPAAPCSASASSGVCL